MTSKSAIIFGLISGLTGVALGAVGSHLLKEKIPAEQMVAFETGVRYQMYHSLLLILLGSLPGVHRSAFIRIANYCFAFGIALFSCSLYALSITGEKGFGMITPFGGLLFLGGWAFAVIHFIRFRTADE